MKPELIAAKQATAEMLKGVGGLEAAAGFCRVGKTVLGEAQSQTNPDRFIPLDVVLALEPLSRDRQGWPHVTSLLCSQMGGVFVPLPEGELTDGDVLRGFAAVAKEYGDSASAILSAAADGRVCAAEAATSARELYELIVTAVGVHQMLCTIAAEGGR